MWEISSHVEAASDVFLPWVWVVEAVWVAAAVAAIE